MALYHSPSLSLFSPNMCACLSNPAASQIVGKTQLRNWMLKNAGVDVVVVRSEEWYRLSLSKDAQRNYLITTLQSVLSEEDRVKLSPSTGEFYSSDDQKSKK